MFFGDYHQNCVDEFVQIADKLCETARKLFEPYIDDDEKDYNLSISAMDESVVHNTIQKLESVLGLLVQASHGIYLLHFVVLFVS